MPAGVNRTRKEPCRIEGCPNLGNRKGHCLSHYVTHVYRKRPEVRDRLREDVRHEANRFNRARYFARRHGMEWTFTREQYYQALRSGCHYCKADLLNETGRGLDRLDELRGYTPENTVPCCGRCNRVRGSQFTPEDMRIMMAALNAHRRLA